MYMLIVLIIVFLYSVYASNLSLYKANRIRVLIIQIKWQTAWMCKQLF